jgi:hypothetical protein
MISNALKIATLVGLLIAPVLAYAQMPFPGGGYRNCPQGAHSESFPNGNGYRCVLDGR